MTSYTRDGCRLMRACDKCRFWSDQQAKITRADTIAAKCLNKDSIHHGKYRGESNSCVDFARGEAIDLPGDDAVPAPNTKKPRDKERRKLLRVARQEAKATGRDYAEIRREMGVL